LEFIFSTPLTFQLLEAPYPGSSTTSGQIKMNRDQPGASEATSAKLTISGMTCSGCANTVKRVLSRVPGVTSVEVDLDNGAAVVGGPANGPALVAAVIAAGYEARIR
jgi:copper chaperone